MKTTTTSTTTTVRKIPFAGIELTSQRVRGYMVPLSYRGGRSIRPEKSELFVVDASTIRYLLYSMSEQTVYGVTCPFAPAYKCHEEVGGFVFAAFDPT